MVALSISVRQTTQAENGYLYAISADMHFQPGVHYLSRDYSTLLADCIPQLSLDSEQHCMLLASFGHNGIILE